MKMLVLLFAALLFASCGEKSSDSVTLPLSDADVERLLKEAVDIDSLPERDGSLYQINGSKPYSGWVKRMYDSGQVKSLGKSKNDEPDGHSIFWHENGQKRSEIIFKDDELISATYWNSEGEEVGTFDESSE